MKTPWKAAYDAGEELESRLAGQPLGVRTRLVGLFYFVAVAAVVFGLAGLLSWLAPASSVNLLVQENLDTIFVTALVLFIAYTIGLVFWQAFFPGARKENGTHHG